MRHAFPTFCRLKEMNNDVYPLVMYYFAMNLVQTLTLLKYLIRFGVLENDLFNW